MVMMLKEIDFVELFDMIDFVGIVKVCEFFIELIVVYFEDCLYKFYNVNKCGIYCVCE